MNATECRAKILALNCAAMGERSEWDEHGREVFDLVYRMADEIELLREAGLTGSGQGLLDDCSRGEGQTP